MLHEALASALWENIPGTYKELAKQDLDSEALQEAYDAHFTNKQESDGTRKAFCDVCLFLLAEHGDALPHHYDDVLIDALTMPAYKLLVLTDMLDEAFSLLAEPRCSMLQEQLYKACLHGLFRHGARVGLEATVYKAQLLDDLQDAFAQASKKPDEWGLEFALLPDERFSPAVGAQLLFRLHEAPPKLGTKYTAQEQLRLEKLLHISLTELAEREFAGAAAGRFHQPADTKLDGLRWLLSALPEDQREPLLQKHPGLNWQLLPIHPTLLLTTMALRHYLEQHAGKEELTYHETLRYHVDKQHESGDNPHWQSAAIALYPETKGAMQAQLRDLAFQQNKYPRPALRPLLRLSESADEHLRLELCTRLYALPLAQARELVEAEYWESSTTGKEVLLRAYTTWAWLEGKEDWLQELLAKETDPAMQAALDTAQARIAPDWQALWLGYAGWQAGKDAFVSPHRQQELVALASFIGERTVYLEGLFPGMRHEPLLLLSFLQRASEGYSTGQHGALSRLSAQYKPAFADAATAMLLYSPITGLANLYQYTLEKVSLPPEVHARWAQESKGLLQKLASQQLANAGKDALPFCLDLLKAKKADARMAGVRALHLLGLPEAVPAMEAALQKERSKKCKQAIEEAIAHCKEGDDSLDMGVYTRADKLEESGALQQLREILYEPGTLTTWVRTCDVLSRLEDPTAFEVGLDYLRGHGLKHWKKKMRVIPWDWGSRDVSSIAQPTEAWYVTASFMFRGQYDLYLDEATSQLEIKQHARKLPRHLVPEFLDWIEVAWRWCEQNKIPLEWLEARLDGGSYHGASRPGSTHLSLWHQFGFMIDRGPAFSGSSEEEGIRWIKVNLPPGHAFRDMYPLRGGNRYLDLRDLFSLEEAQESLGIASR